MTTFTTLQKQQRLLLETLGELGMEQEKTRKLRKVLSHIEDRASEPWVNRFAAAALQDTSEQGETNG